MDIAREAAALLKKEMKEDRRRIAFLKECAKYFEKRPTNGEDKSHWSNVYNAKNCREIANRILEFGVQEKRDQESMDIIRRAADYLQKKDKTKP